MCPLLYGVILTIHDKNNGKTSQWGWRSGLGDLYTLHSLKSHKSGSFTELSMDIGHRKPMLRVHSQPELIRDPKGGQYLST